MKRLALKSVLIVEDDEMLRQLLIRHFQKSSIDIAEATDADQALSLFTKPGAQFDVVIADVHLPGRTGLDLATELRSHNPNQPIVFVTGDVNERLARIALAEGKAGYLVKPFQFFELDAAVSQAVQVGNYDIEPANVTAAKDAEERALADQRAQLAAAAAHAVNLASSVKKQTRRRFGLTLFATAMAIVVILLALMLTMG